MEAARDLTSGFGNHLVVSQVEHVAVLETVSREKSGAETESKRAHRGAARVLRNMLRP